MGGAEAERREGNEKTINTLYSSAQEYIITLDSAPLSEIEFRIRVDFYPRELGREQRVNVQKVKSAET